MAELRMRDLIERTGLSRQAIHFYVEQGLVEPPVKTGKTMGYYSEAHVERILLIKKLQDEHFLPLKAIRAMLDERASDSEFTRAQQQVLRDVKARLPARVVTADTAATIELSPLLAKTGLPRRDITELERAGLVEVVRGRLTPDHAWLVELWGEARAAGFTRELGFGPELLLVFERGLDAIVAAERDVLARIAAALPAAQVAAMVQRALELVDAYLLRLHQTKVRAVFAQVEAT